MAPSRRQPARAQAHARAGRHVVGPGGGGGVRARLRAARASRWRRRASRLVLAAEQHEREHDSRGARGGERGRGAAGGRRGRRRRGVVARAGARGRSGRARPPRPSGESEGGGTSAGSIRSSRPGSAASARASGPQCGQPATWTRISSISAGLERAEHVAAEQRAVGRARAHARTSISSRIRRSVRSAYEVRLLTVPERDALALRDLAQAEPAVVRQPDHLAVLRREPRQRGRHLPAQDRLLQLAVDLPGALGLGARPPARGAPTPAGARPRCGCGRSCTATCARSRGCES